MEEFTVDFVPEGDASGFHAPNGPDEDFRRILVQTPGEVHALSMKIKLVEVHHGKMKHEWMDCQATLLVLEFRFCSRLQSHRYKSASVTLDFLDKAGNSKRNPSVAAMAPDRMHWLNKTTYDRTTSYGASLGAQAGIEGAGADANVHWAAEQTRPLRFKATLTGDSAPSKDTYGDENAATWTMEENKSETDGIPSFLQTAVLLKRSHPGAFVARLRVKSSVDSISALRRSLPLTTDEDKIIDPVTFRPGEAQLQNFSVTRINKEDLEHMERLPVRQYFTVNYSEEESVSGTPAAAVTTQKMTANDETAAAALPDEVPASIPLHEPEVSTRAPAKASEVAQTPRSYLPIEAAASAVSKAAEAAAKAAEAAAKAAEAAGKAADAAGKAAEAAAKAAEAAMLIAAAAERLV